MSGSSLTCRRYLATLDILERWAVKPVRAAGVRVGQDRLHADLGALVAQAAAPPPCPCRCPSVVWELQPPDLGLVDPGWSRQRPIRPHSGPAPGGAAQAPRAGAGRPLRQSCLKLEDIPENLGALY